MTRKSGTNSEFSTTLATGYNRHPGHADFSDARRFAADLFNSIPQGEWAYFADVAKAFQFLNKRWELGFDPNHNHRTIAILVDDDTSRFASDEWTVPWHRMRDKDGLMRSKASGPIYDPEHWANRMFVAEGGRLAKAFGGEGYMPHPPQTIKFDIQRHVRDPQWCGENLPDWAPPSRR